MNGPVLPAPLRPDGTILFIWGKLPLFYFPKRNIIIFVKKKVSTNTATKQPFLYNQIASVEQSFDSEGERGRVAHYNANLLQNCNNPAPNRNKVCDKNVCIWFLWVKIIVSRNGY